jgi:hypothetical protein
MLGQPRKEASKIIRNLAFLLLIGFFNPIFRNQTAGCKRTSKGGEYSNDTET